MNERTHRRLQIPLRHRRSFWQRFAGPLLALAISRLLIVDAWCQNVDLNADVVAESNDYVRSTGQKLYSLSKGQRYESAVFGPTLEKDKSDFYFTFVAPFT